jgi:hypothetical protein
MSDANADRPTEQLVQQRIRNRVIDYLELAASFDEQRRYELAAPIAHIPYEVINQWDDQFPQGLQSELDRSTVYTPDEAAALTAFRAVLDEVSRAVPDDFPSLAKVQSMPAWADLRDAAARALAVLVRRGRMPEDREVSQ